MGEVGNRPSLGAYDFFFFFGRRLYNACFEEPITRQMLRSSKRKLRTSYLKNKNIQKLKIQKQMSGRHRIFGRIRIETLGANLVYRTVLVFLSSQMYSS